jgi:hypothetical protein
MSYTAYSLSDSQLPFKLSFAFFTITLQKYTVDISQS